ncbi:ATP-dependent RNA helicase HrpA [Bifidobacterium sp. 82T24]|uniref:ATP-dependent RNA helicase HrpA n=1 Tax=Bifidobacterium pluvialisilvae TaxID=2834436 RepID=UPI001C5A4467|nr:ATP-dependent RNA helicase HrpA [Bifidobacterium pluvialisilvae]MBW3087758.1 ATP-dependent RNA helicase HrpA [Bifidobacterium pluvialisilvae]
MKFEYPAELPVSAAKDEIAEAVRTHQVVIVSGQTGSGKTTQLPKILLELGRGSHGRQIVHTQPRRIAARTVAERIAAEMGARLGDEIGFQVRFTDESSPKTRLRVVTDGILLAQIQRDPKLYAYDTIVIDEAHERSLNIDFLLGYLTALLPKRRDLKLIITSATIDSVKFQEHFAKALHTDVPVIEVSGRTFPVQVVYEPLGAPPALMHDVPGFERSGGDDDDYDADSADAATAVARACAELVIHSSHERGARDILVFASGERDIHDFESALRRHFGQRTADMRRPDAIEVLPLFARLSAKEQHRVFEPHSHQRIVLATNVAETSLTVPGIRYVVDPGTARISRYSKAAKVQRLPIEPISQASADQRAGRCGRIADGIAIRLYSREDYETRPRFTEPEILRTGLASVVLHMLSVGVAHTAEDITDFGFIDPPNTRAVTNGFNDLTELRAITRSRGEVRLTRIGRQLSRLPIDVRLARMVVEAAKDAPNTLAAVLVVVAFLSLQDPRERPEEKRDEADRLHNRYADESSDFLTALNMWDRFFQADGETSNSALRRLCKAEFMNYPRMRQWRDLYRQLVQMCRELKFTVGDPLPGSRPALEVRQLPENQQAAHSLTCSWDSMGIHKAMLSGLLSSIGMQQVREPKASDFAGLRGAAKARAMKRAQKQSRNEYLGSRGTRFALFPASAVAKSTPQWVMAAELVETSRLWARSAAAIDPAWAEPLAGKLTRTTYAEPHWSASKGAAVASAKVLLYGLPIVQDRTVQWGAINPVEARDFLIREGLVAGEVQQRFPYDDFIDNNRAVLEESDEETARTRHVVDRVTDEDLVDFYDAKLPADITSMARLGSWWRHHHDEDPTLLDFDPSKVERLADSEEVSLDDYPDHWHTLGSDGSPIDLKLSYVYDPQAENDGVTVHVPLKFLSRITPEQFTWNVPGLLDELIVAMIKSLPKALRVQFVPAPDTARKIRAWIDDHYDALPGSGEQGHPAAPPVDDTTGVAQWPDLRHVFTQAAIHVVGAQLHPEVFNEEQLARLPKHVRMTFVVEKPAGGRNSRHGRGRGRGPQRMTVLASSKSLAELQARFAEQAAESARQTVKRQATKAADQGKVVQSANLLHKAGATMVSRSSMLWKAALDALRLPDERISSRWLGGEALMLASAPYKNTKDLVEDLQLAAVKRLLPDVGKIRDDAQLADAVGDVTQVYEDTVYQVARDVIAALRRYAEVDKAVSGTASLPLLSVLQSIREHIGSLVTPGFIGAMPPEALRSLERYLHADLLRLEKAKTNKSRDVNWAWEVDEAQRLVDKAREQAGKLPAGPRHDEMSARVEKARWMVEEFRVSLWAQELGTPRPVSLKRITKALKE